MKYFGVVLLAVLLVVLVGCGVEEGDYWAQYYVWAITKVAQMELQAEALPEGDPKRLEIERALQVHRATLDGRLDRLLAEGLEIETPDCVIQVRYDAAAEYKTRVVVSVPLPEEAAVSHAGQALERWHQLNEAQRDWYEGTTRPDGVKP